MSANAYLSGILTKYQARNLSSHALVLMNLKSGLQGWANDCFREILDSGSRAKGTAISLASDVDYLVSLNSDCNATNGGLETIFDSLYTYLKARYSNVRKQNVSVRINLSGLEVDVTPARIQPGNTTDHWIYLSKTGSRQQTNIKRHISDISTSRRINEIKIIKIWRQLNNLDFPSVYLEYLLIDIILLGKSTDINLFSDNVWHVFNELAKDSANPLFSRVVDPANSNNVLSDLLSTSEKNKIISIAKTAVLGRDWTKIIW